MNSLQPKLPMFLSRISAQTTPRATWSAIFNPWETPKLGFWQSLMCTNQKWYSPSRMEKKNIKTFIFFLSYRKEREKKTYSYGEKKGKGYKQPVQKRIIVNKWKDNNVPFHRRTAQVNNNEISLTFRQRWKLVLRVGEYCKLIFKDLSGVFFGKRYQNS